MRVNEDLSPVAGFLPVTADRLRDAMSELPAGVSILTTTDEDGRPRGATISAVTSLSLEPALLLVCLDQHSETLSALSQGHRFLLHIVAEGQEATAYALARKSHDKFDDVEWRPKHGGLPFIEGCTIAFLCTVETLFPGGDHVIVVGRIERVAQDDARVPLVYHRRRMIASPVVAMSGV